MVEERKLHAFGIKSEVEPNAIEINETKKISDDFTSAFSKQKFFEGYMRILAKKKGYPTNSVFVGGIRHFILETIEREITDDEELILGTGVVMQRRQELNLAIVIRALSETSNDGYIEEEIQKIIKEISEYLMYYRKKWSEAFNNYIYPDNMDVESFTKAFTKIYNEWDGSPKSETGDDIKLTIYE